MFYFLTVYVDAISGNTNPITVTVATSGASFQRSFSIKVTQIECSNTKRGSVTKLIFL